MSELNRTRRVSKVMQALDLTAIGNRKVGSDESNSNTLSKGERRRLSMALVLLSEPKILLADELKVLKVYRIFGPQAIKMFLSFHWLIRFCMLPLVHHAYLSTCRYKLR
jgi:ABC-type microcin C transport system duplicated ATPase subunit YejF